MTKEKKKRVKCKTHLIGLSCFVLLILKQTLMQLLVQNHDYTPTFKCNQLGASIYNYNLQFAWSLCRSCFGLKPPRLRSCLGLLTTSLTWLSQCPPFRSWTDIYNRCKMKPSHSPGDLCPNWIKEYISLKRTKESLSIIAANSSECPALRRLHAEWFPRGCIPDVMRKKHWGKQIDFFFFFSFSEAALNYRAGINNSWRGGRHTSVMHCNPLPGINASCLCLFVFARCCHVWGSRWGSLYVQIWSCPAALLWCRGIASAVTNTIMWICHINERLFRYANRQGG